MNDAVKYAFGRLAGSRRRFAGRLCIAFGVLAVTCPPAAAQLPLKDGAVGDLLPGDTVEQVVDDVVNEPLPEPVEQIVNESPVAPVRDEVRRIVNETTGTGGGGGDGSGSGSGGDGSGSSDSGSGAGGNGSTSGGSTGSGGGDGSGTPGAGSPGSTRERSGGGRRTRADGRRTRARRGGAARPTTRAPGRSPGTATGAGNSASLANSGRNRDQAGGEGQSAAVRTIETIVKAVPTPIWIALGVLFVIALGLGARTFVERRRGRALARDRERLMNDVAALERALLPAIPERVGAVATSVAYRPSDGPAAGGDFYDAFELPDGRAVVLVGDVSGHGADALEATNSVRSQLHAFLDAGMSPRAAIATVGERAPVQLAGRFTTVVVALHDPAAGTLSYATAGHHPPIIVGPAADHLLSAGASPPIGVGLRTGLRETTVALPSGSVACFYTDGLVEAKSSEGLFGRARLEAMVEALEPDDDALALLQQVIAEADETPDDMAVCLVRPVAGAEVLSPRVEVLELDADDIESGFAERFLDACDVPAGELAVTLEEARATVESHGNALLEVTIADRLGRARVSADESAAPPTPV